MFKGSRRFFRLQRFENDDVFLRLQIVEQIGNVFRHPIVEHFAQRLAIATFNEFPDLGKRELFKNGHGQSAV